MRLEHRFKRLYRAHVDYLSADLSQFSEDAAIMTNGIRIVLFAMLILPVCAVFISCDETGNKNIQYRWVQVGPPGMTTARVITSSTDCPDIIIDDEVQQMSVRKEPSDKDFKVLTCEAVIPPGTAFASIGGRELRLPKQFPTRIVVVGDTGCRLETGDDPQSCNDPDAWPFERIAETAASFDPELVIHVGDYLYRQNACPAGDKGCEGSPFGDNYPAWEADFFKPAKRLLEAAPWVFTRGNHEECSRAGKGWFRFLDPNTPPEDCEEFTPPYTVDLGFVRLLMLDSSAAKDNSAPSDLVDVYSGQIDELEEAAGDSAWLVTHHPLWGIGESGGELFMINDTLEAATDNTLTPGINLVMSGHIHFFEMLTFEGGRSPQLIVGNSGTEMDSPVTVPFPGLVIGGGVVDEGVSMSEFGFAVMELSGDVWEISMRDVDGNEFASCELEGNIATCAQ